MIDGIAQVGQKYQENQTRSFLQFSGQESVLIHDRQYFDEPNSAFCGANEWASNHIDLVTCPKCKAKQQGSK